MQKSSKKLFWRGALLALALLGAACEQQRPAYVLTSTGRILSFDVSKPEKIKTDVRVTGLASDESLVQIAYRPANDRFYGMTNKVRLATLDPKTGVATLVNSNSFSTETLVNPTIDFNPMADRLRVIANEQNLRVNPADGAAATVDTDVEFDNDDVNDGRDPQIAAIAYDRNASNASSTTLFALESTTQSLVRVGSKNGAPESPNGGRLFTIAKLGVGFTASAGFDIEPGGDIAYAVLSSGGTAAALYRIDLRDGSADRVGAVDDEDSDRSIISLAVGLESGNN